MNRRLLRRSLLVAGAALARPWTVGAQTALPYKPLRILIGYPSSGGSDSLVHVIAGALQRQLSRKVAVDYRAGDSGMAAGEQLKKATPDGTVVAFMPSATMVGKLTIPGFPFDPLADLQPLTLAGTYATAFAVSPKVEVTTFAEYVAWLKAGEPDRDRVGTTTPGSFTQYFGIALGREIGVALKSVPYRGARPLLADLEQGRVPAGTGGITSFLTAHRAGQLRLLAISAARRTAAAPAVPTVGELGFPKLEQSGWYAFFAPPDMTPPLVEAWTAALHAAIESREVSEQLLQLGFAVETSTPAELAARLVADFRTWRGMLDSLGLKLAN